MLIIIIGGFAKEKCGLFAEQVHRRIYPVKTSCLLFSKFFWLQFSLPIYSFVLAAKNNNKLYQDIVYGTIIYGRAIARVFSGHLWPQSHRPS